MPRSIVENNINEAIEQYQNPRVGGDLKPKIVAPTEIFGDVRCLTLTPDRDPRRDTLKRMWLRLGKCRNQSQVLLEEMRKFGSIVVKTNLRELGIFRCGEFFHRDRHIPTSAFGSLQWLMLQL